MFTAAPIGRKGNYLYTTCKLQVVLLKRKTDGISVYRFKSGSNAGKRLCSQQFKFVEA